MVVAPLLPTESDTLPPAVLLKTRLPVLTRPPKVAEPRPPKLRCPEPLVSSVLCCRASPPPRASVPLLISVLPLKVFAPVRVSVAAPVQVQAPRATDNAAQRCGKVGLKGAGP